MKKDKKKTNAKRAPRKDARKNAMNIIADVINSAISPAVAVASPILAVPAAFVGTAVKNVFSLILDSKHEHSEVTIYINQCCSLAQIDPVEQDRYLSKSFSISKTKEFSQISSSCINNLDSFYDKVTSLVSNHEHNLSETETTKLVDLLFFSYTFFELSKLTQEELNRFLVAEIINQKHTSKSSKESYEPILISKETRRPKASFNHASRTNEISNILDELNSHDKIGLVNGIGGIGKTEICKYLFHESRTKQIVDGIKYVGWITYDNNLVNTLYSQVLCDKNKSTIYAGYEDSLAYLNSLGNKLLLFVDNLDNSLASDSEISKLISLNCKLVITTRIQNYDGVKPIVIGSLNEKWSSEIFSFFCKRRITTQDLHRMFELTQGHPLTVELLAKTINLSNEPVSEIIEMYGKSGFGLKKIDKRIPFDQYNNYLIDHLKRFFSVSKLAPRHKQLLYRFSLFPNSGISSEQVDFFKVGQHVDIEYLANRGWLDSADNRVSMHPIISDTILSVSSNTYTHYKTMYVAMGSKLEIPSDVGPETKFSDALVCKYAVSRKHFKRGEYAQLLSQIAVVFNRMEEKNEAIALLTDCATIKEHINPNDSTLFTTYNNLGLAYNQTNNHEQNLHFLQLAKRIGFDLYVQNPDEYAESYATTLNNLSLAYLNYESLDIPKDMRLKKAEELQLESISIFSRFFGDSYVLIARSYNNLAIVYNKLGDIDNEVLYRTKALEIPNSPERPIHLFNYARMELNRGNPDEAVNALKQAIDTWEKTPEFYYNKLLKAYPLYISILEKNQVEQNHAKKRFEELREKYWKK